VGWTVWRAPGCKPTIDVAAVEATRLAGP